MRLALFFLFVGVVGGQDVYPPDKPLLRIETGMHTAVIRRIDVDAGEKYLVSASDDKTARVWDLRKGQLLRILRPPQGDGDAGKLYAVAISPDGSTVAVGGFTAPRDSPDFPIYIFDRATGALRQSLTGLPEVTNHLAYSLDGRFLVAALSGKNGIRLYETSGYHEAGRDAAYDDGVYWAEFDKRGRLVTASYDGKIRLYTKDLRARPLARNVPGGKKPFSARFSPDGKRIAVGFDDSTAVTVVSARDLHPLPSPKIDLTGGNLSTVAWSQDGKTLCAGGRFETRDSVCPVYCWNPVSSATARTMTVAANTLLDLHFLKGNRFAFASFAPELGVLDGEGVAAWRHSPDIPDMSTGVDGLRLALNGTAVEFTSYRFNGKNWNRSFLRVVPDSHQLAAIDKFSTDPARITGLAIKDWDGKLHPTLNGNALEIEDNEMSRSLAISKTADLFVLGCDWSIRVYDRNGRQQRRISVPAVAYGVNLTADSRYLVAALFDGTIRWYETGTGNEVLALFVHGDLKRWVAWTPEGFFDASPGGESLVGYHLNRGPDHGGEFVKVDQLFDTFYRPDLVSQRLKPGGAEAVKAALANVGKIDGILSGGLAPDLRILKTTQSDNGEVTLEFEVQDRGGGIGRIIAKVDGTPISARDSGIPSVGVPLTITLPPLTPGIRNLSISGTNRTGKLENTSPAVPVSVSSRGAGSTLYVIAAGVSRYKNTALNAGVRFASEDARQIASRLQQTAKGLFDSVIPEALIDPTRDQLESRIRDVVSHLQPTDGFVLYLAGHGTAVNGEYYFLPADGQNTSEATLKATAVSRERLQPLLEKIPGSKTLLLIDTCSGAAMQEHDLALDAIDRMGRNANRAVLAGAASGKMAFEGSNNHGVFTDALLAGLVEAQPDGQGRILITRLAEFIQQRVPAITKQRWGIEQTPEVFLHGDLFAIAQR